MWRNNVAGVRNCSSAAEWRNVRRYSSQCSAVTDNEFKHVLSGIKDRHGSLYRTGLAISGGVDSMALASLFARSRGLLNRNGPPFANAFIVDHKARPGSTEEAEWVAEQCRVKFGMQASVLPLTWPANFDPLDHKRFETDARTLRYQALGRACRATGVTDLMVAHHADDQAETVLMRLANNRLRSGLQAMQSVEWIPECYGIHGISQSGSGAVSIPTSSSVPFERGGIRILRPLLSFPKSRLVATCEEHGVTWVEDKTNHLQTYTSRNAVRYILKHHKLPAALNIESLVSVSTHMQDRVHSHKAEAQRLLANSPKRLNPQLGTLHVQFPHFHQLLDINLKHASPADTLIPSIVHGAHNTAICLLAQAGQLVSPRENPPLGELASTVTHIWPEFQQFDLLKSSQEGNAETEIKTNYCAHGIWWRKCDSPSIDSSRHYVHPEWQRSSTPRSLVKSEWLLTRQPLATHRPEATPRVIRYLPSHMLPTTQVSPTEWTGGVKSDWQLFDGRWWISVRNFTADALILRHFTKADLDRMTPIAIARRGGPEKFIAAALSMIKPADVRYTLPALFQRDMATKKETLIGFPTLDASIGTLGSPKGVCSWRVRYKKLGSEVSLDPVAHDTTDHDALITHATIEKELFRFDKTYKRTVPLTRAEPEARIRPSAPVQWLKFPAEAESHDIPHASKSGAGRKQRTVPIVPVVESERHGRSEKRKGGGYDIKWEDFGKRVR